MLKVLIVDDEPFVREGLKLIIPWEEYGFSICGEGIDGKDGLDKILSLDPDLVLMDIKMPGMYGIEVVKSARDNGHLGKYIMLTGYSDFEYARTSIILGVSDYILKPIDEDELIAAIKKVRSVIENENDIKRHIRNSEQILRQEVLKDIITGEEKQSVDDTRLKDSNIDMNFNSFQVAIVQYSEIKTETSNKELFETVRELLETEDNVELTFFENKAMLLLKGTDATKSLLILEKLHKRLSGRLKTNIIITLGRTVENKEDIVNSYKDAKELIGTMFFYSGTRILAWDQMKDEVGIDSAEEPTGELSKYVEEIYTYLEINDSDRIAEVFRNFELYLKRSKFSPEKVKGLYIDIFVELKERVLANYTQLAGSMPSNEEVISIIYEKENFQELMDYIEELVSSISGKICNTSSDNVVRRVINYMEKNYNKPLRLEALAELFNYNSAYLGKIFRSYTGENFNSYLDRIRIDNAKELLTQKDLKIYEVSERVGFKNKDYFFSKFKKYVGVSPKEYKRQSD
ncbi:response regulator transcription factor [Clostridium thermarum]|uniref:response regulator transcription factor n=1 Tax=Clostridium thermarum TaxID=1716543 RepID=UPI0013D53B94|nr:response regulator transcription factor [Clostridium thermarum]